MVEDEDEDSDDNDDADEAAAEKDYWGQSLESDSEQTYDEDSSSGSEEDDDEELDQNTLDMLEQDDDSYRLAQFRTEVKDSLKRGLDEGVQPDPLTVEINSSRHAYHPSWSDVVRTVAESLLALALDSDKEGQDLLKEVSSVLKKFSGVLQNFCKSESAELDCIYAVEEFAAQHPDRFLALVMTTLHKLYDFEIVGEDAIMTWYEDQAGRANQRMGKLIRSKVKKFLEWLQQSDDDEDDDE